MNIDALLKAIMVAIFSAPAFKQHLTQALQETLPAAVAKLIEAKPEPGLLNADPAAEFLSVSRRTLDSLTARGEIPVVRATSRPQYDPRDLRAYIDTNKQVEG